MNATVEARRDDPVTDEDMANAIRMLSADAVQRANSGHPGMPMGMADVATVLFTRYLKFNPADADWPDRDRFVLSAGHGSMLIYSLLHLIGYEGMTRDELRNFRQLDSRTAGHPEFGHAPGIETTTGPLGQGITTAVGMALAERLLNARYGDDLVDHRTWVIAGDGCLMEGISHEAISLAGHLGLDKLTVFWDDNSICIDGATKMTESDDQLARFAASNWHVQAVDGHDADAVARAIDAAMASDAPSLIACRTVIGRGAPNKAGTAATHGAPLGQEEIAATREQLDWPYDPFDVPAAIVDAWQAAGRRSIADYDAWQARLAGSAAAVDFLQAAEGELPAALDTAIEELKTRFATDKPTLATRKASGEVLATLTNAVETLLGGSADLTGSVNTKTAATAAIGPNDFNGRYIHYGVREHAMAAVMNGIALHGGFVPYGGTFLVFADYMRGAMRLSALMRQRVIYVLTHDSIGLGEDGPTHQPVETLASLRAMPNFTVLRPADATETAECWALALNNASGPSGIVLSRQGLPALRDEYTTENLCARGGYVLADAEGGDRAVTLIATGSEVSIAVAARERLQADGVPTAVVSMPCTERFDEQDEAYRQDVLGPGTVRIVVEAAVRQGWDRYLGETGTFVGMTGFGASAPAEELYRKFGITADAITETARAALARRAQED